MEFTQYNDAAEILKALGHPVRLCIVSNLLNQPLCNVTKMQTCLSIPQSTVSQHLGVLKAKQIITGKRKGTEVCYEINPALKPFIGALVSSLKMTAEWGL
ncbi:MAG: metalloregulator ArsR/SmtB family transcription factor [Bacillota bacterium]|nr:metalloregulator ArsR/SmtB family transcription factor [Bacillota bacterium]